MSRTISKRVALTLALVALCNNTLDTRTNSSTPNGVQAQLFDGEEQELGLIGASQVGFEPAADFSASGSQGQAIGRFRRQISIPEGSPFQQQQQPQGQQSPSPLGFLGQLGPQLAQGSQLFSSSSSQLPGQSNGNQMAAALMGQLSEMIRSTQDTQKRVIDASQKNVQTASQASQQAAQNAQGGIQSALTDIGAGLQRIAANNPNLLPDVKNLYQTVSSKLTSASSSVSQAANPVASGQQQFAQGVASQIANPQPISS